MPCYRCARRQDDPAKGASPWKRGVRNGAQVLVCPDCQQVHDWTADLDTCATCGSTALVRALGETRCKTCGAVGDGVVSSPGQAAAAAGSSLADEVAAALSRVFDGDGDRPSGG